MTHIKTVNLEFKSKLKWQGLWGLTVVRSIRKEFL
jgi:hypothetical protein